MKRGRYLVKVRRGAGWPVRPTIGGVDGRVHEFYAGWVIEAHESTLYAGETAMIPAHQGWLIEWPSWIASGDLVPVEAQEPDEDRCSMLASRTVFAGGVLSVLFWAVLLAALFWGLRR